MFGSRHPALTVLTGHETALPIDRTTVREAGRCQEDVSTFAHLVIAEDPIIRDVAEQHESAGRVIPRSLQPSTAGEESGNRTVAARTCEARIQHLELCRDEIGHRSSCDVGTCVCSLRRLYRECALARPKGAPEPWKAIVAIIGLDHLTGLQNTWGGSSAG